MSKILHLVILFFFYLSLLGASLAKAMVFTLAIDHAPPYSDVADANNPHGLSVDVTKAMIEKVEGKLDVLVCPWARCLALGESGEADLIAGAMKTPAREQYFVFINPPFFTHTNVFGFYTLGNKVSIKQYDDLTPLRIGIQRGAKYFAQFDQDENLNKQAFNTVGIMVDMLLKGRIDAFVHVKRTIQPILDLHDKSQKIQAAEFLVSTTNEESQGYVMISKKSRHIDKLPALEKAMAALRDEGKINEIMNRYLKP